MSFDAGPHFRALDAREISAILTRNDVGRLAYQLGDHVDVVPMHYIYSGGWIYGRTSPGEKLTSLGLRRRVAFEVDEVQSPFDWRSVVVRGGFYPLSESDEDWRHALDLLRASVPETLAKGDPTPFRTVLFRIAVQECTGREASSAQPAGAEQPGDEHRLSR